MTSFAERMDAVDRGGILSFRGMKSLQPTQQLILGVRIAGGVVVQRTLYARLYSGFRPKSAVFRRPSQRNADCERGRDMG